MTRRFDDTVIPGWEGSDLMDLQRETQNLLASVRAPSSTKGFKVSSLILKIKSNQYPTTSTERRGVAQRQDETGGAGKRLGKKKGSKTKVMASLIKGHSTRLDIGRETVEVLDTLSNPSTARSEDVEEVKFDGKAVNESTVREFDFIAEEQRVMEVRLLSNER